MNNQPWAVAIWKRGDCLDLWSVNHILAGAILGYSVFFLDFSFWSCFTFSILVIIAWEIYEMIRKVEEKACNKIMDVLTSVLGFIGVNFLFIKLNYSVLVILFVVFLMMFIILELWGHLAYRKKSEQGLEK